MTGIRDEGRVLVAAGAGDLAGGLAAALRERYAVRVALDPSAIPPGVADTDVVLVHANTLDASLRDVLTVLEGIERERPLQVCVVSRDDVEGIETVRTTLDSPVATDLLYETVERLLSRADYDAQLRRYFAVAARVAVLETRATEDDPTDDEYQQATTRADQIRASLEAASRTSPTTTCSRSPHRPSTASGRARR